MGSTKDQHAEDLLKPGASCVYKLSQSSSSYLYLNINEPLVSETSKLNSYF